jgi:hypothetical protein
MHAGLYCQCIQSFDVKKLQYHTAVRYKEKPKVLYACFSEKPNLLLPAGHGWQDFRLSLGRSITEMLPSPKFEEIRI